MFSLVVIFFNSWNSLHIFIILINFCWESVMLPGYHLSNYIVSPWKFLLQMCLRNNLTYNSSLKIIQFCLREIHIPVKYGFWLPGQRLYETVSNFSGLKKIGCDFIGKTVFWVIAKTILITFCCIVLLFKKIFKMIPLPWIWTLTCRIILVFLFLLLTLSPFSFILCLILFYHNLDQLLLISKAHLKYFTIH